MKFLVLLSLIISTTVMAKEKSIVVDSFLKAVETYQSANGLYPLSPEIQKLHGLFELRGIDKEFLNSFIGSNQVYLAESDKVDKFLKESSAGQETLSSEVPKVSIHVAKIDVIVNSDPIAKDNLYGYFFVTDGVVPTGKVTSIYKGLSSNESFFFNEFDRVVYPVNGIRSKVPDNHLIVDYGLIESDGDDIEDMKKLTDIIIDIAIIVYSTQDPVGGSALGKLRKEIKALTHLVLERNHDDRLFTGTITMTAQEIAEKMNESSILNIKRTHYSAELFNTWRYNLHFRLLRD